MWEKFLKWAEQVGTARASAELARLGYPDLAQKIKLEKN